MGAGDEAIDDGGEAGAGESVRDEGVDDNVRPFQPRRPPRQSRDGSRRTSISGRSSSEGDDSKMLTAHARMLEVEGASDRLGLGELRETLSTSELARRDLTTDILRQAARHDENVDRIRDEYERAAEAAEGRHNREALRWRGERDLLLKEIEGLKHDVKDAKKSKKRAKKSVQELEIKIEEIRDKGDRRREVLGFLAPGVPIVAERTAEFLPELWSIIKKAIGGVQGFSQSDVRGDDVKDRAAAIRFAGRLFHPNNADLLGDLQKLAFNVIDDAGTAVVVPEWERVQRFIWSAIQREAEAEADGREVVDEESQ